MIPILTFKPVLIGCQYGLFVVYGAFYLVNQLIFHCFYQRIAERLGRNFRPTLGVVKFGIGSEVREDEQSGTEALFVEAFDNQVVKGAPDSDKAVFGIVSHSVLAFRREGLELVSAWYNDIVALKSSFCPFYGAGHGLTAVGSRKRDTRTGGSIVRNIYARYGKRKGKCFEKSRKLIHNQ